MASIAERLPSSRELLRWYSRIVWFSGLLAIMIFGMAAIAITANHRRVLALPTQLTPWFMMASAFMASTFAEIEDPLIRRRCGAALALAVGGLMAVAAIEWFLPLNSLWRRDWTSGPFNILFWLFVVPFVREKGTGLRPSIDATLTRWFGPVDNRHDSATRRREEEIRDAAFAEERNRLARDLHDSIKQEIFAIHTSTATAQERFERDPAGARAALEQVRASARDAMTEMEALLDRLHAQPLENTGLTAALQKQCEAVQIRTGAEVTCKIVNLPKSASLPPDAHEAILRVAQEALSNAARHARATRIDVELAPYGTRLRLRVEDNGNGLDRDHWPHGMGVANMRARTHAVGGDFSLASRPGKGTIVRIEIPVLMTGLASTSDSKLTRAFVKAVPWLIVSPMAVLAVAAWWEVAKDEHVGREARHFGAVLLVILAASIVRPYWPQISRWLQKHIK